MITSYVLAVAAAVSNAGSNVLQRHANREEPSERSFSFRLILDLLKRKDWWGGIAFVSASFVFQAGALGFGELAAVQPIIVLELPLTMIGARIFLSAEMHRREWASVVLLTAGLAGLVGFLGPHGGRSHASLATWAIGGGGTALLVAVLVVGGRSRDGDLRAGLFGAGAGVTFGMTAAFMKSTTGLLAHGIAHVFVSWQLYAMVAAGAIAMYLVQNALQAGKLVAAQPGISLLDPFTSIAWGVLAFDERTRTGIFLWIAGLAAVAMVAGAVLLSQSPVMAATQEGADERANDGKNRQASEERVSG